MWLKRSFYTLPMADNNYCATMLARSSLHGVRLDSDNRLDQGWAIVLARGPLCGSGGWRRAAPFKMIAFIS
jgi:hypothetical protein